MKHPIVSLILTLACSISLSGCRIHQDQSSFETQIDDFCAQIQEMDEKINKIDAQDPDSHNQLLGYLNELDTDFQTFAAIDFPTEYDYLEKLADESSSYMTEAVSSYRTLYNSDTYDTQMAEYAQENYHRAYKRIRVILQFLRGENPEDVSIEYGTQETLSTP